MCSIREVGAGLPPALRSDDCAVSSDDYPTISRSPTGLIMKRDLPIMSIVFIIIFFIAIIMMMLMTVLFMIMVPQAPDSRAGTTI
jgi:hypothetical protein